MNTSKAFKPARSKPVTADVRNPDMLIVAHDNTGHFPISGHEEGNLAFDLAGYCGNLAGQFVRNNLMGGYPAAIEILKPFLLTGLETACLAVYFLYRLP
ncbi:MAG: hypothetical protein JRJ86_21780 [Deltaproteobacteria bacterium]|nr:hypothetical protein [Deltaproteobacteria bacterium]